MKRKFLIVPIFLMATCLSGCSPQVTPVETITHEAGEALAEDVLKYATFKNPERAAEATLDLSNVVVDKVGTYEATITLKEKEYPFTVEVVDTTAPDGTFNELVVTCGLDDKVVYEDFICDNNDISEFKCGLRNAILIKNQEELKPIISENLKISLENGNDQISYMDLVSVQWNKETDTWDEKNVSYNDVKNEFIPSESGLYRIEKYCVDEFGNANITYVYVLADIEPPILIAEDKEFFVSKDFNEYLDSLNEGVSAQDNLLGDMNSYISIVNNEILEQSNSKSKMKITYEVYDLVGNKAEVSRTVTAKSKVNTAVGSIYGPKLNQSQLDEVNEAVNNFVSNYITPGMSEYQKVKAANDYLCSTVSYAASWATNGANTAWGALIYHEAQCSGYARAMKALCDGMGIGCYYVHADSAASNPSHQWNVVCVDGNWYICDVQGNDDYNNMTFLVSDSYYSSTFGMSWDRSSIPACPNNY